MENLRISFGFANLEAAEAFLYCASLDVFCAGAGAAPGRRPYFAIVKAAMKRMQNATACASSFQPSFRTANGPGFWMK